MPTPSELDPATLKRQLAELETESARLEIDRAPVAKESWRPRPTWPLPAAGKLVPGRRSRPSPRIRWSSSPLGRW